MKIKNTFIFITVTLLLSTQVFAKETSQIIDLKDLSQEMEEISSVIMQEKDDINTVKKNGINAQILSYRNQRYVVHAYHPDTIDGATVAVYDSAPTEEEILTILKSGNIEPKYQFDVFSYLLTKENYQNEMEKLLEVIDPFLYITMKNDTETRTLFSQALLANNKQVVDKLLEKVKNHLSSSSILERSLRALEGVKNTTDIKDFRDLIKK